MIQRLIRYTVFFLCLTVLASAIHFPLFAQDDPPLPIQTFKDIHYQDDTLHVAVLAMDGPVGASSPLSLGQVESADGQPLNEWTRLAVQALTESGWDIFTLKSDGSDMRRLTADSHADTNPALGQFGAQVVFTSNRDGNRELYLMPADGSSGPVRLTNNAAQDDYATWSPDGSRIAFASNRSGSWEIYTMASNGSDVRQITNDPNSEDITPDWSRQGLIAWTKRQGRDGTVWSMNADGSNPQRESGKWPYLSNPKWNPSGEYLFFDADVDNDNWNEIVWFWRSSDTDHIFYDAQQEWHDVWVNSWSPGSEPNSNQQAVLLTRVIYAVENNRVTVRDIRIEKMWEFDSQPTPYLGLTATADWKITDGQPPVAFIGQLEPFTHQRGNASVYIPLSGYDVGGSGLARYERQQRVEDGPWSEPMGIWVHGNNTFDFGPGERGKKVSVRIRAVDRAGNYGFWTDPALTTSWFYAARIVAQVQDIWGNPLDEVTISSPDLLVPNSKSDPTGNFYAYAANSGNYNLNLSKTGYADLQTNQIAVPWQSGPDIAHHFRLMPHDNLIANSDFESSDLSAWTVVGGAPSVAPQAAYTGNSGLFLAERPIGEIAATMISSATGYDDHLTAVFDTAGVLHIAWRGNHWDGKPVTGIRYVSCVRLDSCSAPQMITDGNRPSLALVGGKIALLDNSYSSTSLRYWEKGQDGWHMQWEWQGEAHRPKLLIDANQQPHIFWMSGHDAVMQHTVRLAGAWQPIQQFPLVSTYWATEMAMLNTQQGGTELYVLGSGNIAYRYVWQNNTWSTPAQIPNLPVSGAVGYITVLQDPAGMRHLVLTGDELTHVTEQADGSWTTSAVGYEPWPQIKSERPVGAVWREGSGLIYAWGGGYYGVSGEDGSSTGWMCQALIDQCSDTGDTILAINPLTGEQAIVYRQSFYDWEANTNRNNIFVKPFKLFAEAPIVGIQRRFDLRAPVHSPVLDMFVNVRQNSTSGKVDALRIWVGDDNGQTAIFGLPATVEKFKQWQRHTLDLSPWAGKQITLTLALANQVDGSFAYAEIDRLSLGSWTTPIVTWAEISAPEDRSAAATTAAAILTIRGKNFMDDASVQIGDYVITDLLKRSRTELQLQIPTDLPAGFLSAKVLHSNGASARLPILIPSGEYTFLPRIHR